MAFAGLRNGVFTVDPGTTGDATVTYSGSGIPIMTRGVDRSAGSVFRMASGADLSVNTTYQMDLLGRQTLPINSGFSSLENVENDVTGDGTVAYLGAKTPMTIIENRNSNVTAGNGLGVPAIYTAPIDGMYLISFVCEVYCPGNIPFDPYFRIEAGSTIYYVMSTDRLPAHSDCVAYAGSCLAKMAAGNTAKFACMSSRAGKTDDIVSGAISGVLVE